MYMDMFELFQKITAISSSDFLGFVVYLEDRVPLLLSAFWLLVRASSLERFFTQIIFVFLH